MPSLAEYVVLYLRMSSDDQTVSIRQQRDECLAYIASKGYLVLAEYIDEGKSGSREQEKRTEFQRLIKDSVNKKFTAIVCWNTSRFGRMDSIDSGVAKGILRQNGVRLETVKEGVIDWNTFEGRIIDAVLAELNNLYSRNLGTDSLRGKLDAIKAGNYPHGSTPYGFDRLYSDGSQTIRVERKQKFRKPKKWTLTIVPNENEAKVVRWLFTQFTTRDVSNRQLALELDQQGIASPDNLARSSKAHWSYDTVGRILSDKIYIGTGHIGTGRKVGEAFARATPTEVTGLVERIIEPAVFVEAQRKIEERKKTKRNVVPAKSSPLSGVAICGHCGYRMQKSAKRKPYFVCSSPAKRPHLGCHQWRIMEDDLMRFLSTHLVTLIDNELAPSKTKREDVGVAEQMKGQLETLRARVKKATARLLECDDGSLADAKEHVAGLREELGTLEERYALMQTAKATTASENFGEWWFSEAREKLIRIPALTEGAEIMNIWRQGEKLEKIMECESVEDEEGVDGYRTVRLGRVAYVEPDELRNVLHRLGVQVVVTWKQVADTPRRARGTSMYAVDTLEFRSSVDWNSSEDGNTSTSQGIPVLRLSHVLCVA